MEVLSRKVQRARKQHVCQLCGNRIMPGDLYVRQGCVHDGRAYTWKCHDMCEDLAYEIWDFVDPDEGMSRDEFKDGLMDIAADFICDKCPLSAGGAEDCGNRFKLNCIQHMHEFFEKYKLARRVPWQFELEERCQRR